MTDFAYISLVWVGTVGITFFAWFVVHFNGKVICGLVDFACSFFNLNNKADLDKHWLNIATGVELILLGIMPLAIASLVSTANGNCYSSVNSFLFTEAIVLGLFFLLPNHFKQGKFWSEQYYRSHWAIFAIAIVWCLIFAIWTESAIDPQEYLGAERLLVNKNGDMWYYVRRYAAYTLNNVSFDGKPACHYLQLSPKKLSSFIGSIIIYLIPNTVLGITLFQGLLGCSLFLSLFSNWYGYSYHGKKLSNWGTVVAIIWAIASPSVFWLLISAYLSNALFITVFVLSITAARRISLKTEYPTYAKYVILFAFILNIFSFYLVILPIALIFYLAVAIIYNLSTYSSLRTAVTNFSKILFAAGLSILLCSLLFNHQIGLEEVSNNLNALREHGKNFVPLNPWSLLQEKPNPMPNIKDFGVWFNIAIGIIFSGFSLRLIYRYLQITENRNKSKSIYYYDLIAAVLGISVYIFYLLAYIPLEYTYRLGKLAISLIYPLAILGMLPAIFWFRDRYYHHKPRAFKIVCLTLVALHVFLHIDKIMSPRALPMGKYIIVTNKHENVNRLTIVGCQDTSISQRYERLVGLDIGKKYSELNINVVPNSEFNSRPLLMESYAKGIDISHNEENLCLFEISL